MVPVEEFVAVAGAVCAVGGTVPPPVSGETSPLSTGAGFGFGFGFGFGLVGGVEEVPVLSVGVYPLVGSVVVWAVANVGAARARMVTRVRESRAVMRRE